MVWHKLTSSLGGPILCAIWKYMGNSLARRNGVFLLFNKVIANSYLLIFSIIVNSYYRGIEYYSTTGQKFSTDCT